MMYLRESSGILGFTGHVYLPGELRTVGLPHSFDSDQQKAPFVPETFHESKKF